VLRDVSAYQALTLTMRPVLCPWLLITGPAAGLAMRLLPLANCVASDSPTMRSWVFSGIEDAVFCAFAL
jgi:hypothetical protein